ncbi:MAG: bifunctional riboflavin kinase/FAD synthetase [Peptococcaceae bacterium]|nr:bifunctional riboflavin kinase/FAD synthetase [Peptococcaceae bacterium]
MRKEVVIALGNFDGVHIGHQVLIRQGLDSARAMGMNFLALLFMPHPQRVLYPERGFCYLTDLDEKRRILSEMGTDEVRVYPFTREFAALSPEEFVVQVLAPLSPAHVVVGYNYTFGRRAQGGAQELMRMGQNWGFSVDVVPEQRLDGVRVSSSDIRQALRQGHVEVAARMLGRLYRLRGCVEKGCQRGRELGFPTANMRVSAEAVVPRMGVYAARVRRQGKMWGALVNIGFNPTFAQQLDTQKDLSIEVHLLDFTGEIYGEFLAVDFLARIRSEKKFESGAQLAEQIRSDVVAARAVLGSYEG